MDNQIFNKLFGFSSNKSSLRLIIGIIILYILFIFIFYCYFIIIWYFRLYLIKLEKILHI